MSLYWFYLYNLVLSYYFHQPIRCPDFPEEGYPKTYDMKKVLDNWNADDTTIPPFHYNSLCYFDYKTEFTKALNYRNAELPFVVYNHPEVLETVEKWGDLNYLNSKVGPGKKYKTASSKDNHFMYYSGVKNKGKHKWVDQHGKPWEKPTTMIDMSLEEWLNVAVDNHNKSLPNRKHLYFR